MEITLIIHHSKKFNYCTLYIYVHVGIFHVKILKAKMLCCIRSHRGKRQECCKIIITILNSRSKGRFFVVNFISRFTLAAIIKNTFLFNFANTNITKKRTKVNRVIAVFSPFFRIYIVTKKLNHEKLHVCVKYGLLMWWYMQMVMCIKITSRTRYIEREKEKKRFFDI